MVRTSVWNQVSETRSRYDTVPRRLVRRLGTAVHHGGPGLVARRPHRSANFEDGVRSGEWSKTGPGHYEGVELPLAGRIETRAFPNPVLTARDVDDYGAVEYVADPFLLPSRGEWHLFFEVFNPNRTPTAVIGHATSADQGTTWTYEGIALDPGVHVSFPYVFRWDGSTWMVPNLNPPDATGAVELFEGTDGGEAFRSTATLVTPDATPTDRVVFRWKDRWWLLLSLAGGRRELHVYHSDSLKAEGWTAHRGNPVVKDAPRIPGGRPLVVGDRLVVFFQNGPNYYGECVEGYEITRLTPTEYEDVKLSDEPVVGASDSIVGWNSGRMHTFDPWYTGDGWICAVDGDIGLGRSVLGPCWSIGLCSIRP